MKFSAAITGAITGSLFAIMITQQANGVAAEADVDVDVDVDLTSLGTPNIEELDFTSQVTVDADCNYEFQTTFKHQDNFPVGTVETCLPSVDAPEDGLPILNGRWRYHRFPSHIREATGIDHLSVDFNPCGHPTGGFLTTHYDLHFYKVSPAFRAKEMICKLVPGTPACMPNAQNTPQGHAFFNVGRSIATNELANMPPGFDVALTDAVINMGMHAMDYSKIPDDPTTWVEPTYVLCTYNGQIIAVEPMLPFKFVSGDTDHFYEEDNMEYVEQSISTLPNYYSVDYESDGGVTTVTLRGVSDLCQAEFAEKALNPDQGSANNSSGAIASASFTWTTTLTTITTLVVVAGSIFLGFEGVWM